MSVNIEIQKSELYYFLVKPINSIKFKLFGVSRFGFDSFSQRTEKTNFWNQCHKRSLTVQNDDFSAFDWKKYFEILEVRKKTRFCDASERRVRVNVAKFMPKNRLWRTKWLNRKIYQNSGLIKAQFTNFLKLFKYIKKADIETTM